MSPKKTDKNQDRAGKIPRRLLWLAILCPPLAFLAMGDICMAIGVGALLISTFYTAWIVVAPLTVLVIRRDLRMADEYAAAIEKKGLNPLGTEQVETPPVAVEEQLPSLGDTEAVLRVKWPGMWFVIDARFTVTFDDEEVASVSARQPFEKEIRTNVGTHVLRVSGPLRRAKSWTLDFSQTGYYLVQIEYSRASGNFKVAGLRAIQG